MPPQDPSWHQLLGMLRDASESEDAWALLNDDYTRGTISGHNRVYHGLFRYMEDEPTRYRVRSIWLACAVDPDQLPEPEQDSQMDWLWTTFFPLDMTELLSVARACPALVYHAMMQNEIAFNLVREDVTTASAEEASEFRTVLREWFESQEGVDTDTNVADLLELEVD